MHDVFSQEVPDLLQIHLNQLLASGISIEVMRERGYRSILGRAQLDELGFDRKQQRTPGILMPQFAPDGTPVYPQYKPDIPRKHNDGKPIKYENIKGRSMRLDVPIRCAKNATNPNEECWLTEGIKKSDSLASHGAPFVVNITGVWNFKSRNEFGAPVFKADFDLIAWKGRDTEGNEYPRIVNMSFDSDIITKPQVSRALTMVKAHLERKGAKVYIVRLPDGDGGKKQAVDDFLAAGHTLDDLRTLASPDVPEVKPSPLSGENTFGGWRYGTDGLFSRDSRGAETLKLSIPIRPSTILYNAREKASSFTGIDHRW